MSGPTSEIVLQRTTKQEDTAKGDASEIHNRSTDALNDMRSDNGCEYDAKEVDGETRDGTNWQVSRTIVWVEIEICYYEAEACSIASESVDTVNINVSTRPICPCWIITLTRRM